MLYSIATLLLCCHSSISVCLSSGLGPGHCSTLILVFSSRSVVELLRCLGPLFCCLTQYWPKLWCQRLHLPFDTRILWNKEEVIADFIDTRSFIRLQKKSILSSLCQHAWQLLWGLCADMLFFNLFFRINVLCCAWLSNIQWFFFKCNFPKCSMVWLDGTFIPGKIVTLLECSPYVNNFSHSHTD